MSPKVTMAFTHCERGTVGAETGTTTGAVRGLPNPQWREVLGGWEGQKGITDAREAGEEQTERRQRVKGVDRHGQGSTQGARKNPHQAGRGRGIAKD